MTQIGSQLLGRIPSPRDDRDWKLGEFLGSDAELVAQATDYLKRTIRGYHDARYVHPPTRNSNWGKAFALLSRIAPANPPLPANLPVIWQNAEPVLDQADYGTCVGNGWAQWGNTAPIDDRFLERDARAIYYESTVIGGSPDDPDAPGGGQQGSTVRDGAKAMVNRGRLGAYAFASTIEEIRAYLAAHGPLVVGTDWTGAMFWPDDEGYVTPAGSVEGGHCYLLCADYPADSAFGFENSWGDAWGVGGFFKMKWADFERLLNGNGEACAGLELGLALS